jgi:hypothetical protein
MCSLLEQRWGKEERKSWDLTKNSHDGSGKIVPSYYVDWLNCSWGRSCRYRQAIYSCAVCPVEGPFLLNRSIPKARSVKQAGRWRSGVDFIRRDKQGLMRWLGYMVVGDPHDLWPHVELHIYWFTCNVQNVLALVDTRAKRTLVFGNPTKFQGPTAVMHGYDRHSI